MSDPILGPNGWECDNKTTAIPVAVRNPSTGEIRTYVSGGRLVPADTGSALPGLRAVLIGHSYIDNESDLLVDGRSRLKARGSVVWGIVKSGLPITLIKEMGIGGERIQDVLDRVDLIDQYRPNIIFVEVLTNDLKNTKNAGDSVVTGLPYATDVTQTNPKVAISRLETLYNRLLKTGATVIILGDNSPANGAADKTKHLAARTIQVNRWCQYKAANTRNLYYIPLDRVTYDPADTTGEVKSGYFFDSIHPSAKGAFYRGDLIAACLKRIYGDIAFDRAPWNAIETFSNLVISGTSLSCSDGYMTIQLTNVSSSNQLIRTGDTVSVSVPASGQQAWNGTYVVSDSNTSQIVVPCSVAGTYTGTVKVCQSEQVFDNPLFRTQTGGSITGGGTLSSGALPAGVSLSLTTGSSVSVAYIAHTDFNDVADGIGFWLELTVTGAANAEMWCMFLTHRSLFSSPYNGRINPGDTIRFTCDMKLVSCSGLTETDAGMYTQYKRANGTTVTDYIQTLANAGNTDHANAAFRGIVETVPWTLPSGGSAESTAIDGNVHLKFGAGGGAAVIRIGRVGVFRDNQTFESAAGLGYQ